MTAARAAYIVTRDEEKPERRLFLPLKNNIGNDRTGYGYAVQAGENGAPAVLWEPDYVQVTANEALATSMRIDESEKTERDQAKDWLAETLAEQGEQRELVQQLESKNT